MNILPLVLSLLVVFSFLSGTFLKEVKSSFWIETSLDGYYEAERGLAKDLVSHAYKGINAKVATKGGNKKSTSQTKTFSSARASYPPLEPSKFYLKALVSDADSNSLSSHVLYEPLAELLRRLYKENLFSKFPDIKNPEYELIRAIVKKAQTLSNAKLLSDLYPDDKGLQKIYCKMLKGTNHYTETDGIPPLAHFISLEKSSKAMRVNFASKPVLESFWGDEATKQILEEEKNRFDRDQKQGAFAKNDFENLVAQAAPFDKFLDYSGQVLKKKSLAKRDFSTNIGIEREL